MKILGKSFVLTLCLSLSAIGVARAAEAPAFSLKTPQGGTVNFPADAQHRPSVIMFWPSWCPFSRALQPYVQNIWEDYRDAGVKVWTINIKEDKNPVQVMKDRGLSFPLLLNGDALMQPYHLQYTPWLVVVDGNNQIVYTRPPSPPTPIDTAREVRGVLNGLLGAKAVALPTSYPKPYDLHLKGDQPQNTRLAATPIAASEWGPWVDKYLAGVGADETVAGQLPRGPVTNGKAAIGIARELWTAAYGADATHDQAPYRSYFRGNRWVVLGSVPGGALGGGFVLVIAADSGRIIRLSSGNAAP